jgi:uncharacterized phage infection (PIP) family protein YhgE
LLILSGGENTAGEVISDDPGEDTLDLDCCASITPVSAEDTMKYAHLFLLLMVLSVAFYMSGCATRPTEMIQLTEQVRQEAANEHADQFAMEDWSAAEKAWQDASTKLDAKSYSDAYNLLLKAKTKYIQARDIAKSRRTVAIAQINQAQQTAALRLKALKEDPGVAKLSAARRKELDAAVKQFEDSIAKVGTQLQNAQYTDALNLAQRTTRDIWEAQQQYLKK